MSQKLSWHGLCKIVTIWIITFHIKINLYFYKIWIMNCQTLCEMVPIGQPYGEVIDDQGCDKRQGAGYSWLKWLEGLLNAEQYSEHIYWNYSKQNHP